MRPLTRVFVYEYLSGGGADGAISDVDVAELLAQGRAMRDAIVGDLAMISSVATTYATRVPERAHPRAAPGSLAQLSPRSGESALDFVGRHAASHDRVWVVAPETAGILAELRRVVGDARWVGCSMECIRIASSKRDTSQRLRAFGIRTPQGIDSGAADGGGELRWVVKPDDGAGACDTRVHRSLAGAIADRDHRAAPGRPAVVEAWEDGEALSLSLLCADERVELLSVNRQRIDIAGDGTVRYRGVDIAVPVHASRNAVLVALARDVARALPGLRGYVGVDIVMRRDGVPVVIEVNPRLTCAYVGLSEALGRNVARKVLALHGVAAEFHAVATALERGPAGLLDGAGAAPESRRQPWR